MVCSCLSKRCGSLCSGCSTSASAAGQPGRSIRSSHHICLIINPAGSLPDFASGMPASSAWHGLSSSAIWQRTGRPSCSTRQVFFCHLNLQPPSLCMGVPVKSSLNVVSCCRPHCGELCRRSSTTMGSEVGSAGAASVAYDGWCVLGCPTPCTRIVKAPQVQRKPPQYRVSAGRACLYHVFSEPRTVDESCCSRVTCMLHGRRRGMHSLHCALSPDDAASRSDFTSWQPT